MNTNMSVSEIGNFTIEGDNGIRLDFLWIIHLSTMEYFRVKRSGVSDFSLEDWVAFVM